MRISQNTRAALVVCLGIFAVSSVATFFLMRLLLVFLAGSAEVAREAISPQVLALVGALGGLAFAVVFFNNVKTWIKENGLPGVIPPPDPLAGKGIRVALMLGNAEFMQQELYSQWVEAHYIGTFLQQCERNKLHLLKRNGMRLVLIRTIEDGRQLLLVKLRNGRKTIHSLELAPGRTVEFVPADEEKKYANCFYPLAYVGCTDVKAWLKIGGEYKIMTRLLLPQ